MPEFNRNIKLIRIPASSIKHISAALCCLLIVVSLLCFSRPVSAAACSELPSGNGVASTTVTVKSTGSYRIWLRAYMPSSGNGAFYVAVDNSCATAVGGSALPGGTFSWVGSTMDADAPFSLTLAKGTHTISVAGQGANIGIDRILLLTSGSCTPTGNGSNCLGQLAAFSSSGGQTETGSSAVTRMIKLAARLIGGVVIITALVFICLRLVRRLRSTPPRQEVSAPAAGLPPMQPQAQLSYGVTPAVAVAGHQNFTAPTAAGYKQKILPALALLVIAAGVVLLTVHVLSNKNIAIGLADAKVSSPAQIVPKTDAVNGSMVQFGGSSVIAAGSTPAAGTSSTGTTSPSAGSTPGSPSPAAGTGSKPTARPGTGTGTTSGSGTTSGTGSAPTTPTNLMSGVSCNYQDDTWSGDASGVGYSVSKLSSSDGNPASFSVKLNAHSGTTEVVGYPSDQCLIYAAMPANLSSSYAVTPPASSSGLDYEYAYDIWLTTASAAKAFNWDNDLELMIWNYTNGQVPAGSVKSTLSDGSKVWVAGNNTSGTVSVVLPGNTTSGNVNIASIVSQLKTLGYVSSSYDGVLDVEYGIEAPYGGGQTFTVNSLSLSD